jgi:hypothetical protein
MIMFVQSVHKFLKRSSTSGLFAGYYNPVHTRVGHAQISGNVSTGIAQFSYRNLRYRTTGFNNIPPAAT